MSDVSARFVARITVRPVAGREREVLLLRRQGPCNGKTRAPASDPIVRSRPSDLGGAREKAQHVPAGPAHADRAASAVESLGA